MRKIGHHRYRQKDLTEFWSEKTGWLHIGDLVHVDFACWEGGRSAMVIGFFVDHHNVGKTIVALQNAAEPNSLYFYPSLHCKIAKVRKAKK